ncbi:MAG: sulfatase [Phycisphaerae bacterium]|nr:sulfatase [Phycisphaerae bacterium]OUX93510.1 MAG: sulfatase [Hyphomonas sp. TMED17]
MNPSEPDILRQTRRHFLSRASAGVGAMALASLGHGRVGPADDAARSIARLAPHFAPRAKRIIYLFQSGGPSQLDLFDHKPALQDRNGEELPDSVRQGQRLTGMSGNQASLPMAGAQFKFRRHGECGMWVSELLPRTAAIVDDLCFVRSMQTEAINHDPAITFLQTGSELAGRPSMGAWVSYGLGTENRDLPAFVVLMTKDKGGQPLYSRLWGSGFLESRLQGVQMRAGRDPVLYLANPEGVSRARRRRMLDRITGLDAAQHAQAQDPEIHSRLAQYELAYRMQMSVPEVTDLADEPAATFELYGEDARVPGTYAANCLLARRLAERDVRFIQLYHQGWDQHGGLPAGIRVQARETDQASAALVTDLKRRGLLEDTLVVWGGEFGRTNYSQGALTPTDYGRDHHPRCFTMWMAGGGVKPGVVHGRTDELGYNVVEHPVHVHDLQATLLHQLGLDHTRLTHHHQGRDFRLTDVHGRVVRDLLI